LGEVEAALKKDRFKMMTVTHVDTSTGVITDVKALAGLGRQYGTLVVVDGVCSVAGEELRMSDWGVDLALTASQKAIGVPPGLALLVAGPRAMDAFQQRKIPVGNFYADWAQWLPIMKAYEARKPGYFGTPAVNLIWALNVSLGQILDEGMEARFERHQALSRGSQAALTALGLDQVPLEPEFAAHTMTAPRYPKGITAPDLLPRITAAGAILAGGLHPDIRAEYFRIGHMGAARQGDLLATIGAIEAGLAGCGYQFEAGAGVAAAAAAMQV
jgi:alanine-glyoxylate transaminase/serine-glyoxylate transaminase/serine-pyruvate transaminase